MIQINNTDISEYVKSPDDCILSQEIDTDEIYRNDNVNVIFPSPESYKLIIRLKKYNDIKEFIYSIMNSRKEINFHIELNSKNCNLVGYPLKFELDAKYEEMIVPLKGGRKTIYARRYIIIYNTELTFLILPNTIKIY